MIKLILLGVAIGLGLVIIIGIPFLLIMPFLFKLLDKYSDWVDRKTQ